MRRREFITLLGGAAAAWPLAARAQQAERMRRIGVLDGRCRRRSGSAGPHRGVRSRGCSNWAGPTAATCGSTIAGPRAMPTTFANTRRNWSRSRRTSSWLSGAPALAPLLQATRTVPIVFVQVADPVGAGFVESLARPGGNATGFIQFEYSMSGEMAGAAQGDRAGRDARGGASGSGRAAGIGQFAVDPVGGAVARGGGEPGRRARRRRDRARRRGLRARAEWRPDRDGERVGARSSRLIIALAARHRLPAVYPHRSFVAAGGLISYGPDLVDQYRRAAGYVDRILKGEKPADLPVQAPTKYELVINLKTAKALGLDVPPTLLARADEVIE